MKYINKKTQAVIDTDCVIHGENWEELKTKNKPNKPKKKSQKKDDS